MLHLHPIDKADALNRSFAAQCSAPTAPQVPSLPKSKDSLFTFAVITPEAVPKALGNLQVWKANGLDGISARLLEECRHQLAWLLSYIFNLSLSTGVYPEQWKNAVVLPLYKQKGNSSSPSY